MSDLTNLLTDVAAAPVLDEPVLREITGAAGMVPLELVDMFVDDFKANMTIMRDALPASDREVFNRSAHSMKSSAGNVGAQRVALLAAALEKTTKYELVCAIRRSQANAIPNAAPAQAPLTAATTGLPIFRICRMSGLYVFSRCSAYEISPPPFFISVISCPALKTLPLPVMTTQRTCESFSATARASCNAVVISKLKALARSGRLRLRVNEPD